MGSYLSVHNNTRNTYNVKVGIDEAAVRVFTILVAVITAVTLIVSTAGAAAPKLTVLAAGSTVKILGLTATTLLTITKMAAAVSGTVIAADATGWALATAILISQELEDEHYYAIPPNQQHKYGRYTLSLWRQATCTRVRPDPNNPKQVLMDTVYMRPIFTGATDNSTLVHDIQFWINKWDHENLIVVEAEGIDNISRASIDECCAQMEGIDWMKVIVDARAKAKKELLENEGIGPQENYA